MESNSKKDQIKLLKGMSFSIDQLMHFIFFTSQKFGYLFSQYRSEHLPADIDKSQMPTLIHKKSDSEIQTVGNTNLSDGQMKRIIEQRSVKVSKFIDKGDNWHCFFLTFNSIGGKEAYKDGQSHLHYISNYWGLKRDFVLNELKSKNYKLPSLPHIDFERHKIDKSFSSTNE